MRLEARLEVVELSPLPRTSRSFGSSSGTIDMEAGLKKASAAPKTADMATRARRPT
jgi:hypothetical protein